MKNTGKIISKLRLKEGLTTSALAHKLKVKESTIKEWENGTKFPTLFQLKKMAKLFNVEISKLASDDILIQSIERNYHNMWIRMLVIISFLVIIVLGIYFNYRNTYHCVTIDSKQNIYIFTGSSEHFKFDKGYVLLDQENKYMTMSEFNLDEDLDIKSIVINIAFNETLWKALEYEYDEEVSAEDWIKSINISDYGKKKDSFIKYKNTNFPDDFKVEVNYCLQNNTCHTELINIKAESLN